MWVKKIIKVGNSLGVVVPIDICRALEINRGDFVVVALAPSDNIVITKVPSDTAKELIEKDVQIR